MENLLERTEKIQRNIIQLLNLGLDKQTLVYIIKTELYLDICRLYNIVTK